MSWDGAGGILGELFVFLVEKFHLPDWLEIDNRGEGQWLEAYVSGFTSIFGILLELLVF